MLVSELLQFHLHVPHLALQLAVFNALVIKTDLHLVLLTIDLYQRGLGLTELCLEITDLVLQGRDLLHQLALFLVESQGLRMPLLQSLQQLFSGPFQALAECFELLDLDFVFRLQLPELGVLDLLLGELLVQQVHLLLLLVE